MNNPVIRPAHEHSNLRLFYSHILYVHTVNVQFLGSEHFNHQTVILSALQKSNTPEHTQQNTVHTVDLQETNR